MIGLVSFNELKPSELVGLNKDSYLILEKFPPEYDFRVKAMELNEKPKEDWSDVGGLEDQIKEIIEAIVLPITTQKKFKLLGIMPPKGCLCYGPPGTGKTLIAKVVAGQTKAKFLKLSGPHLVQA